MLNIAAYAGGRSYILKHIFSIMPQHKVYIEVFGGLAPVLLNKPRSRVEIYNDIDDRLVNMLIQIRDHPDEFERFIEMTPYSQGLHQQYLDIYFSNKFNELSDLEKALITFYLIATSFNGNIGNGMRISLAVNEAKRFKNRARKIAAIAERLKYVTFTCMDYREIFDKWGKRNVLMFLDPPYIDVQQYYAREWRLQDHVELAQRVRNLECDWILVYNDHPLIRQLYRDYSMREVEEKSMMENVEPGEKRRVKKYLLIWRTRHVQATLGDA